MAEVAVNALAETRKLTSTGLTQNQAEATVEVIHTIATTNVAQKSDIELVKKDIDLVQKDIELVRKDIKHLDDKVDAKIENVHQTLDAKIENVHQTLDAKIDTYQEINTTNFALVRENITSSQQRTVIILGSMMGGGIAILTAVITIAAWFLSTSG